MTMENSQHGSTDRYWNDAFQPRIKLYSALVEQKRGAVVSRDTLALVEDELRALQAQSAQFYNCINALRPVSRLSPELLSIIFHYLSMLEPAVPAEPLVLEDREGRRTLAPTKTWVKITHVCSLFRQCAISDRSLWRTTTTAFGPEWMNIFAERCQGLPESVHVGSRAPALVGMRSILQKAHAVQITSLSHDQTLSSSVITLPEVRSLRVDIAEHADNNEWNTYKPAHDMPHLTDLHIHNVLDFDVNVGCVTGALTSLYIGSSSDPTLHNANDVLDALARLPRLESLILANCDLFSDNETNSRSISVPALKYLLIESETFADVVLLFDALEFSTGVTVHLAGDAPFVAADMERWACLEHALSKPAWADLHTIELMGLPEEPPEMVRMVRPGDEGSLIFSAWRKDEPAYVCITGQPTPEYDTQLWLGRTQDLRPKPDFSIQLMNYMDGRSQDKALGKAVAFFKAATDVRTLSMRPGITLGTKLPWLEILVQYPRLTAVRVDSGADFNHLLETLYFAQDPMPATEIRTISLPHPDPGPLYWNEHVNWTNPTNKNKKKRGERGALLANILKQRAAAGALISSIYLEPNQLLSPRLWNALENGGKGHPAFLQELRQIFKPVKLWNWEDWGRGL